MSVNPATIPLMLGPDHVPRLTKTSVLAIARAKGAKRMSDLERFVETVFGALVALGVNPDVMLGMSAHETDFWRSPRWEKSLNPGGIGSTDDGAWGVTLPDGRTAALAMGVHLAAYAVGDDEKFAAHVGLDPRYRMVDAAGYGDTVGTLAGLGNGRWASDKDYAAKVAARIAELSAQEEAPMVAALGSVKPADLIIEQRIISAGSSNRPGSPIHPVGDLWITQHTTGNTAPHAGAEMHAIFVEQGGGPDNVSFHLTVDDVKAIQLLPLDEIAYHASDGCNDVEGDLGCFASIAIELCVNKIKEPEKWAKAKANAVALIAAICKGDKRLNFGRTNPKRFSPRRMRPHRRWSWDLKWCPTQLMNEGLVNEWDGSGPFMEAAVKLVGNVATYATAHPMPLWTGRSVEIGPNTWHAMRRKITTLRATTPLAFFGKSAKPTGPKVGANKELDAEWEIVNTKTGIPLCWVTIYGSRIDANDVKERVLFSKNKA